MLYQNPYIPYQNYYNQFQNYQQVQQQPQLPQQQPQMLNGKIVDSEDVAKSQEVVFGSYGIFPQADMKKIFVKNWNNDGTTKLITYLPVEEKPKSESSADLYEETLFNIYESIQNLEKKFEEFKPISNKGGASK